MRRLKGSVVSEGVARGEAFLISSSEVHVRAGSITRDEVEKEVQRLERAVAATRRDIENLKESTRAQLGEMTEVLDTYLAFLGDQREILEPIHKMVRTELLDAPTAVTRHFARVVKEIKKLPEPLCSRSSDLVDIERRIVNHLVGRRGGGRLDRLPRRVVIIADDLSPTQTATLDREKVLGFATDRGGPASHTAILARHLGIPAVVGLGDITHVARQGDQVIIDGINGEVIIDPNASALRDFGAHSKRRTRLGRRVRIAEHGVRTLDGSEVQILGNIDGGEGARELRELGVAGVGLFRTEFLYLGREEAPDEDFQTEHYGELLERMAPHPVSIRTMDFGADKFDHRVGIAREPNPFLGMRAIRLSFHHEDLFRTQLRAILRASPRGHAQVMFPMITDVGEFRRARALLHDVMSGLERDGVAFDRDLPVGAMIELPSAALNAQCLLREADFVSLGTNDLTQYTLAVDRTNARVTPLFKPHHPAVLRLMKMAVDAAREAGKEISACGEMAGSARYSPLLLGLGVMNLSMGAPMVPEVVQRVRRLHLSRCMDLAQAMLRADDASASEALLEEFLRSFRRR